MIEDYFSMLGRGDTISQKIYFTASKDTLKNVEKQAADFSAKKPAHLPDDYWKEYIAATFINTVRWWIARGLKETPQEIFSYFSSVVKG